MSRYTVIYPPTILWEEEIFQRPHQLQSEFARLGHFAIFSNRVDDTKGTYWFKEDNLCISNNLESTIGSKTIQDKMTGSKIVLWLTLPETIKYRYVVNPDIIVFDYIDESVDEFSHWRYMLSDCMAAADIIFASSQRLYEITKLAHPAKSHLLQNGADVRQYFTDDYHLPEDLKPLKNRYKYLIGFIGSLHSWINYNLIEEMALERPGWGFVFIGPNYYYHAEEKQIPNLHFLGWKKYDELVHYVKNFHAGIIPFELRDMTQSANPIKMYEYFAAEIPVLATPIKECIALEPFVRIANNGRESVEKLEKAILAASKEKPEYLRIAKENSWTKRVDYAISIMDQIHKP